MTQTPIPKSIILILIIITIIIIHIIIICIIAIIIILYLVMACTRGPLSSQSGEQSISLLSLSLSVCLSLSLSLCTTGTKSFFSLYNWTGFCLSSSALHPLLWELVQPNDKVQEGDQRPRSAGARKMPCFQFVSTPFNKLCPP